MGKRPDQKSITIKKTTYEKAKERADALGISVAKLVTDCIVKEVPTQ